MIKSIFLLNLIFILNGFTTLNAQLTENSDEIFIDQTQITEENNLHFSFTAIESNLIVENTADIRYIEQFEWIVDETRQLNGWDLYPDSEAVKRFEIFGTEEVSSHDKMRNLLILTSITKREESALQNFSAQREPDTVTTSKEDEMKEFRKVFERVLQEQEEKNESSRTSMLEIDRMVHDETRSKVGRDFFDQFYLKWQPPHDARNFAIRVAEAPGPNPGTIVLVIVNQNEVVRVQLQPGDDRISEAGTYAVHKTVEYLNERAEAQFIY